MRGTFVVQLGPGTRPAEVRFKGWVEEDDSCTEQHLVCGFGAGQPIAPRETSFVQQRYAVFAELSNKVKNVRKRYVDARRGTAALDSVFESQMKGSARIN